MTMSMANFKTMRRLRSAVKVSAALTIKFAERTAAAGMAACALCATREAPGRGTKSIAVIVGAQEEGTLKAAGVMSTLARNATMVGAAVDVSKVKDKVCSNSVLSLIHISEPTRPY